jgi:hypothetical protein
MDLISSDIQKIRALKFWLQYLAAVKFEQQKI